MTLREAATQILQEAGEPLTPREIMRQILAKRLWKTAAGQKE